MTYATAVHPGIEERTCANCPHFDNFHEPNGRGWCRLFDHDCKVHHEQTQDCINSSDLQVTHELEDNLEFFPNLGSNAFPTEAVDEADLPHTEYKVGSVVKIIDSDEHHTEWGVFEVIDRKHNQSLAAHSRSSRLRRLEGFLPSRNTESYLAEASWYFRLAGHDDASTINKDLWVREDEICHFEQSHLISTEDIF